MDDKQILRSIVLLLVRHPAEWFTFRRAAFGLRSAAVDADVVAGLVEYRRDLFAVSDDRRFKLRPKVSEAIAQQGFSNWQLPPMTETPHNAIRVCGTGSSAHREGCYCKLSESNILLDLANGSVPDEALLYSCCWKEICRVRGLHFHDVPDDTWREICQRRGYLRGRENPRGF